MLKEYETQSTLNPKLWDGDQLKPGLNEKFLRIADAFYKFLELPEKVQVFDVLIIGSNANYNWTEYSDIDLHVVINYQAVGDNLHLVKNYLMAKKSIWNNNYPLKLKGMDIELYAQDQNDQLHASVGQYSLMTNEWLKQPSADVISIDDELIQSKADPIEYEIETLMDTDPRLESKLENILTRLYKMRQNGLEAEGEYSVENLAFKKIRNSGLLDRIKQLSKQITMSQLQVEQVVEEQYDTVLDELAAHMSKQKILDDAGWHDYGYPGGQVFEIPVTPEQNTLLKKLRIRLSDMNMMTEQDFAGPFGKEHNYADYGGPWGTGHHHKTDFKKGPGKNPMDSISSNWPVTDKY